MTTIPYGGRPKRPCDWCIRTAQWVEGRTVTGGKQAYRYACDEHQSVLDPRPIKERGA